MSKKLDPDAIRALIGQLEHALTESPSDEKVPTISELWTAYEPVAKRLDSYKTITGRMKHVLAFFGSMQATDVGLADVERYRQVRATEITIRKTTTTPATRNREIECVVRILHWALLHKRIVAHGLNRLPKEEVYEKENNVRRTVITEAQLETLCRHASPWLRAVIITVRDSGMRRSEAISIRWDQLDFRRGLIFIDAGTTKNDEGRATMLSKRAAEAIKDLPRDRRSPYVFVSPSSRTGRHYNESHVSQAFRLLCNETGVRGPDGNVWLHDGRRTFVTKARHAGIDTTEIREMSGHKTDGAFKRYNIINPADVVRARVKIEAANDEEIALMREERKPPKRATAASPDADMSQNSHPQNETVSVDGRRRGL